MNYKLRIPCRIVSLAVLIAMLTAPALAQKVPTSDERPGRIAATVTDPNDDPVPGATVVLQGPGSSEPYTTVANEDGFFELHDVRSGIPYRVTIQARRQFLGRPAMTVRTNWPRMLLAAGRVPLLYAKLSRESR